MPSTLQELADLRPTEALRALGRRLGAREDACARALAASVPTLVGAFARLAGSPAGARLLQDSLEASVVSDVSGALGARPSGPTQAVVSAALGAGRTVIEEQVARAAGLERDQACAVLAATASLVLGALALALQRQGGNLDDLRQVLVAELALAEEVVPGSVGVVEELLDAAPDADLGDEIADVGAELLARMRRR